MCDQKALQDCLHPAAPIRGCYGCGSDNEKGLRIKSFLEGDEGVCTWKPEVYHQSYPGFLNGGVTCTLVDCHCAWTAFVLDCREKGLEIAASPNLPTGWTRAMNVEFLKPIPLDAEVTLRAKVIKKGRTSRTVTCSVYVAGRECVRSEVTIVMGAT
jgi:acyl-coenzyme A thioesterase PaaI-like protein